jgi:hypothetical protein
MMSLDVPASRPGLEQTLYTLSTLMHGSLPKDGLPKNVREVKIEGEVAEFLIAIDFSDKKCLEESIDNLRNLTDILSAGSHR